jgi:hypothetical protein
LSPVSSIPFSLPSSLPPSFPSPFFSSQCEIAGGTERKSVREVLDKGKRSVALALAPSLSLPLDPFHQGQVPTMPSILTDITTLRERKMYLLVYICMKIERGDRE